jgi:hypothetical protein
MKIEEREKLKKKKEERKVGKTHLNFDYNIIKIIKKILMR